MARKRVDIAIRKPDAVFRDGDRRLALSLAGSYALLAALGGGLAYRFCDGYVLSFAQPWLQLSSPVTTSLALGLLLAFVVIGLTRFTVKRFRWAKQLHSELRPVARRLTTGQAVLVAVFSSLGEELLFRSLLVPIAGLVAATLLFGLLHQMRGDSRLVWALWATVVGGCFGSIFVATGSLAGPLLAHALINAVNLRFLRNVDVDAPSGAPSGGSSLPVDPKAPKPAE